MLGMLAAFPLASTQANAAQGPVCPPVGPIDHWMRIDESTIVIQVSPQLAYKVTFAGACRKLETSVFARVESQQFGTLTCLSPGDTMIFGRGQSFSGSNSRSAV